jgi:hypothetical protein
MNDHILKNALDRLPQYSPPAGLWEEIESVLEADEMIAGAVRELPSYTPPGMIWENIAANLDQIPQHRTATRLILSTRVLMVAASLAILLAAALWLFRPESAPAVAVVNPIKIITPELVASLPENNTTTPFPNPLKPVKNVFKKTKTVPGDISFSQKVVDNQLMEVCREQENEAFELVQNLCREQMPVCEIPEFKSLKTELDELTLAQTELREALGQYADDPQLVSQMVQIERERAAILQKLIQFI